MLAVTSHLFMPIKVKKEMPIADWAARHNVPLRTATSWAKTGKITAKKRKRAVQLTVTRLVETYFVGSDVKLPA